MTISPAMQEYLAETYRIAYYHEDGEPYISTTTLAEEMHVSAPAVTRMVQRLKKIGLLEHEPYQGIKLTKKGEKEALLSIRKHRLVERFLVDVMGFGWHEVHDSADVLGANVSPRMVSRMNIMANKPKRCPHGEPIPTEDGIMPRVIDYPLNDVEMNQHYIISRVHSHDAAVLQYLEHLGLKPGTEFHLVEKAPFNGPIQLNLNDEKHFIGVELAQVLRVCSRAEYELV
ncbi:metal-dependent transcriptional regulator [Anaerolineales bacterium]